MTPYLVGCLVYKPYGVHRYRCGCCGEIESLNTAESEHKLAIVFLLDRRPSLRLLAEAHSLFVQNKLTPMPFGYLVQGHCSPPA